MNKDAQEFDFTRPADMRLFMKTHLDPIHYQLLALRAKMHGNPDQVDATQVAECLRLTKLYNTTKKINLRLAKILIRSR